MFEDTIEDQLKEYLIGNKWFIQIRRDSKTKKETQNKVNEEIQKIQEKTEKLVANKKKKQYEILYYETYPNLIGQLKLKQWTDENNIKNSDEYKKDPPSGDKKIKSTQEKLESDIDSIRNEFMQFYYSEYYIIANKVDPTKEYPRELDMWATILQKGDNLFNQKKKEAQELAKKIREQQLAMLKKFQSMQITRFDNEKALQKIAEIPIKIEDKIDEIKDLLDKLLGKYVGPVMNPNLADFDINVMIEKIKSFLNPLLACIGPLESVGGKVPILADLNGILTTLSSASGGGKISKEEIKKLLPQKPEIPGKVLSQINGIIEDIKEVGQQLPMLLINIIFQMIGVIIGLFEQIAGVIGVPGIPYPLSLLPQCLNAWPIIKDFVTNVPGLLYDTIEGLVKDKLSEAMLLSIPKPSINMDNLKSLIPKIEDPQIDKSSSNSKPETKKKTYTDVVKEYHDILNSRDKRYSKTDVQRVLKSYKEIYNGSNKKINYYKQFKKDEKSGNLIAVKETITRYKGTPEDFEEKMSNITSSLNPVDNSISYQKIKKTSSIVGGAMYEMYSDLIKEKEENEYVVLLETIKPKTFML